jgi:hypothetical protein
VADQTVPAPVVGARFRDPSSEDGYGWEVEAVDEESGVVALRGLFEGEPTEARLAYALNRWHMLFVKGMLAEGEAE